MNDVECPYCGEGQEINHDDGYGFDEDETYEQECGECEKTFAYTTGIILVHEARKADCLNGSEHDMKPVVCFPNLFTHWLRCDCCGHEDKGPIDRAKHDEYFQGLKAGQVGA